MVARWHVLCAVDTAKAVVPFQHQLRQAKDRLLGYRREPDKDIRTIRDGLLFIEWLGGVSGATVLEIGTGWQPLIPILLSLAGARVYMADLHRLMRLDTFRGALEAIRENQGEIARRLGIGVDSVAHAVRECHYMHQRLRELRLEYLAPCDCRHLPMSTGSMDIVLSRVVLEHVPPAVVQGIFREACRVLRPAGRMLHEIDHSDHWSHRDHRLTAVNFLRYPDWLFRLTCLNPQNYQNRLRHSEYVSLLEEAGFKLERQHRVFNPECAAALRSMRVAERFRRFEPEELATTSSILLARPRAAATETRSESRFDETLPRPWA
jgi:SAM-dependent methyltransferase